MKTAIVHARVEPQTKQEAEGVLRKLGLTPTEAIRIFYKQISLRGGLPFPVEIPTNERRPPWRKAAGARAFGNSSRWMKRSGVDQGELS